MRIGRSKEVIPPVAKYKEERGKEEEEGKEMREETKGETGWKGGFEIKERRCKVQKSRCENLSEALDKIRKVESGM